MGSQNESNNIKILTNFLSMEYLVKTTQKRDFTPLINSTVYVKVPQQKNGYDCGIFLLQYVEMFLKVRSQFIQKRCKHG